MISAKQIKKELRAIWKSPNTLFVLQDREYIVPVIDDIKRLIAEIRPSLPKINVGEVFDCDDFAIQAHAYVKKHYYDIGSSFPVAFGECIGTMFYGREANHTKNICYSDAGIMLVDVKSMRINPPGKGDSVWFIKM